MKTIFALMFGLILTVMLAASAFAASVPVSVEKVEVDGFALTEGATNARDLERGQDFDVKIQLKADNGIAAPNNETKDVQVFAFISGFEFSKSESISDETRAFDMEAGHSVVKTLTLKLPDRADEDTYRLRIVVAGRNNDEVVKNYAIKVQPSDTKVVIKDLDLSPEEEVKAGGSILAVVRVKNLGDSRESDVKIKVSIPELGISDIADSINELDEDESATSNEFLLKTKVCDKPGVYNVKAVVTFDEGDEQVSMSKPITVTAGNCDAAPSAAGKEVSGQAKVWFVDEVQNVGVGVAASYPITVTNGGTSTKVFMLSVDAADWADVKVSPSSVVTVKAGETQTAFVSVSAKKGTAAGERAFSVSVKDSSGNVLQSLALKANVASGSVVGDVSSLRNIASVVLVVLVVVLVIVGLLLAFRRVKGGEGEESQTYY